MLSVVDETDDDWGSITTLGSWDDFDDFFQQKYIDSECFASGCTVVVTNADGVVHRRRFGGHKDGSIFCVYSVTKIVTTIACLQLRDAGKLRLDDPLSTHLPYWLDEARPTEEGVSATPITIRHALNHTSGLGYYASLDKVLTSPLERAAAKAKSKIAKTADLAGFSNWLGRDGPALFEPGAHFGYSDVHTAVAHIVERVSGMGFEAYLQQHIFGPLGMVDATFKSSEAQRARFNTLRVDTSLIAPSCCLPCLPRFIPIKQDLNEAPNMVRGDGGLKGSMEDWVKLNCCLLNGGASKDGVRILSSESVAEMCTSSVGGKELTAPFTYNRGATMQPDAAMPSFGIHPAFLELPSGAPLGTRCRWCSHWPGQTVGLGVLVAQDAARATLLDRAAGIAWWVGMGSTCFGFHPEAKVGVLVYGTHASPLGGAMGGKGRKTTTRLGAFRDTINAAFHLDRQ